MKKYIVQEQEEGTRVDKVVTRLLQEENDLGEIPRSFVSGVLEGIVFVNNRGVK